MTATATTFYVKSEIAEGLLNCIPCLKPRQVFENLEDQRKMGRKAWVEDVEKKILDEMTLQPIERTYTDASERLALIAIEK